MKNRKDRQWSRLDNAAKIFPPSTNKRDTKVFRFACELNSPVDELLLQRALQQTMELFPGFRSVLKHGLFWYYLETSDIEPQVELEHTPPCSPIYDKNVKNLLFRVMHYKNRISVEVYHALSDGTGVLQFLRVLVCNYLALKHEGELAGRHPMVDYDASSSQKMDDSFRRYYDNTKKQGKKKTVFAYKIKGAKLPENRIRVIEGILPVPQVLAKARELGVTVTVLFTAVLMDAIYQEMAVRDRNKPVVVTIPVNLRKYFYSESARNFFGIVDVGCVFGKTPGSFQDLLTEIGRQMKEKLKVEALEGRMNSLGSIERNVFARATPLVVKDFFMKIAYDISAKQETATISNVGKIEMPEEFREDIRLFDVFVSTNKLQICMCSFGENMAVSFTSPFSDTDIQRRFFRTLTGMGIPVEIAANQVDEE